VSVQLHTPAALPHYLLDRRLGGSQSRSVRLIEEKILDQTGTLNSEPSVVEPVASRYTDCYIPALLVSVFKCSSYSYCYF
jgi:hypothetical protein